MRRIFAASAAHPKAETVSASGALSPDLVTDSHSALAFVHPIFYPERPMSARNVGSCTDRQLLHVRCRLTILEAEKVREAINDRYATKRDIDVILCRRINCLHVKKESAHMLCILR